ncbi:MAG: carbon-nitrogen hydrolase family protein [Clostridiales bacterium]|nr:carbon-nitrogen hydrolase family protein [Clostridiales bacterium]
MKIALFQMTMGMNMAENLKKCISALQDAAQCGADLILYPELTLLPFFPQYEKQNVSDKAVRSNADEVLSFQKACRKNRIYAVPNFYYEENQKRYDASFLITATGEIQGIQKMVHIAQAAKFYEQDYYAPSDDGFLVFQTPLGNLGIVVCFDRHYPESIRTEKLKDADLILIPTANTKAERLTMFEWEIRVQAFQNCIPIVMCNRTGTEGQMAFAGKSLAVDADGNLIVKTDDREQLIYVDIDIDNNRKRCDSRPYVSLRRPELYS